MDNEDEVRLNVGGRIFVTEWETLRRPVGSKLCHIKTSDKNYNISKNEFYFDRGSSYFEHILDLHRTGSLHVPSTVCIPAFLAEMEYWDVGVEQIAPCCYIR